MNSFKAAKLLVAEGAPACVYDNLGDSALSLLIEKIPEVALTALDQFHTIDYINRREFYFLNYLEKIYVKEELQETPTRSPLEIAVQNERCFKNVYMTYFINKVKSTSEYRGLNF